jgi:hypothetical protein
MDFLLGQWHIPSYVFMFYLMIINIIHIFELSNCNNLCNDLLIINVNVIETGPPLEKSVSPFAFNPQVIQD